MPVVENELAKLSDEYDVIALDNRFISERVNELKRRKVKFVQVDILDLETVKHHIQEADYVHHLAGITDVAYVKKDSDKLKDALIEKVAIEGTQNILNLMNKNDTIIFP